MADTEMARANVLGYLMDVDERIQALDLRLRQIEERVAVLEKPAAVQRSVAAVSAPSEDRGRAPLLDLATAGKSLLILGGAFLLRAATESAALPKHAGVILGLLYAAGWIGAAAFSMRNAFAAAAAAVIAYPIVWEATTHFDVMGADGAAGVLALFGIGLMFVARRTKIYWLAWIAAAGATFDSMLLAYATKDIAPFLLELAVITLFAVGPTKWVLAVEGDLFGVALVAFALIGEKQPSPVIPLLVFAALSMVRAGPHTVAGALVGFAGATAFTLVRSGPVLVVALPELALAVVAYAIAMRRNDVVYGAIGGVAAAAASLLVFGPVARAVVCGVIAIAMAELAKRRSAFGFHSTAWGVFAATASLGIAAPFCFIAFLRDRSFALLAIAAAGAVVTADSLLPTHALVRTALLAVVSLALAIAGRQWRIREASQLAIAGLVVIGVQVVIDGMRSGAAGMMFVALAVYGGTMLGVARLRRVAVAGQSDRL